MIQTTEAAAPERTIRTEEYKGMRFEIEDGISSRTGRAIITAKAWSGPKAKKPYAYFTFRTVEQRDQWIAQQKEGKDASERMRAERKEQDAQNLKEMRQRLTVGTILAYSWGWEQTNVDFYEVVGRKGAGTVILRAICSALVPDAGCGPMSGHVTPCPGKYREGKDGEPFEKRINAYGVTMDHGIGQPTEPDKRHYCSWYG